ncbi:MAG: flagellar hook-basal body complex protein FliE [Planctomycetota bacterium]|nr:MAG: flagellar hook-basal body complex protein FliE [Planctomycetota bacterium]
MAEPSINKINSISKIGDVASTKKNNNVDLDKASFKNILENSISEVNKLQMEAGDAVNKLATGEADNLSEVMIAVKKSDVAFTALMETRNKLVEAYNEIMRMRF